MTGLWRLAALCVALAACSGGGEIRSVTLSGQLTYPEPITLPPGAQVFILLRSSVERALTGGDLPMRTSLFDAGGAHGGTIIARDTIEAAGPPPIPFTLRFDRAAMDPAGGMVIDAWITAGEQVLFAASAAPRMAPGAAAPTQVTLRRPRHVVFACADGTRLSAAFAILGDLAFLESDGGRPMPLRAQPAGAGFRYEGGGYSLRGKGREAVLRRPSGSDVPCQAPAP